MISTKTQQNKLYKQHIGTGFIVLRSSENEIIEIEICVDRNGTLCRIANGKPLFPITFYDDEGIHEIVR